MIGVAARVGTKNSLGVILMNEAQRNLVVTLARRELAKLGLPAETAFTIPGEPLFIRTIDLVQGEERDVVIVGMTYGRKSSDRSLPRTLGPFSAPAGRAKLNVGLTKGSGNLAGAPSTLSGMNVVP